MLVSGIKRSVYGTDAEMSTLTQLQQNRRVIQDFTLTTLANIPGLFTRLVYMASLRDLSSGKYEHAGLGALYPEEAVQQALQVCHEQVFEKVLETSLETLPGTRRALARSGYRERDAVRAAGRGGRIGSGLRTVQDRPGGRDSKPEAVPVRLDGGDPVDDQAVVLRVTAGIQHREA